MLSLDNVTIWFLSFRYDFIQLRAHLSNPYICNLVSKILCETVLKAALKSYKMMAKNLIIVFRYHLDCQCCPNYINTFEFIYSYNLMKRHPH